MGRENKRQRWLDFVIAALALHPVVFTCDKDVSRLSVAEKLITIIEIN